MSKLKKLRVSEMSKSELQAREMNKLLGGSTCCICDCAGFGTSLDTGNSQSTTGGEHSGGGYGTGSYA